MEESDDNDWAKNGSMTVISDAGKRIGDGEAGGSQESFRTIAAEVSEEAEREWLKTTSLSNTKAH